MKIPTGGTARKPLARSGEIPEPTVKKQPCGVSEVRTREEYYLTICGTSKCSRQPEMILKPRHCSRLLFLRGESMTDEEYMKYALRLARRGCGFVSPNPMVGAVIVKNNTIIGEGWHTKYGCPHAEREALAHCSDDPCGADIYVTLEPCCHYGKQPPCTDALIEAGIKRVFVGSPDPNPLVAGKGVEILRSHGIEVHENILREECDALNEIFLHYITSRKPFVAMKYAMTADGKISAFTGASKWITGEKAREDVHFLRKKYSAIMVGIGTAIADDPMLNCRIENGRDPVRIVCDSHLALPLDSRLVRSARDIPLIIASCCTDAEKQKPYLDAGCDIITVPQKDDHTDLAALIEELGRRGIDSVLTEGGGTLNWSMLKAGIVNKVYAYIAPKLLGGKGAPSPVGGEGFPSPDEAVKLRTVDVRMIGEDILIESEVTDFVHGNS